MSVVNAFAAQSDPDYRQMAQLVEYVGVDYSAAVTNGQVVNEAEYQEMLDFSRILVAQAQSTDVSLLIFMTQKLETAIHEKQLPEVIQQLGSELRSELLMLMPKTSRPSQLLSLVETQELFQAHCSACHGILGKGDGPASKGLEPSPTDFTNRERAQKRSILGLYDAISNGIEDTAMVAFVQLSEEQRWSLAFYAGSLAFEKVSEIDLETTEFSPSDLIEHNPLQLAGGNPQTLETVAHLRADPETLFSAAPTPLQIARGQLLAARESYGNGDYAASRRLAVSAYLDGFELIENSLDTRNSELRKQIEANMMALRKRFDKPSDPEQLDTLLHSTLAQLDNAEQILSSDGLSNSTLFGASLVILLREGLEALLVTLALAMVLIRSERRDALKFVHAGWITALVAGGVTWWAARFLVSISGASREVMEGVAAMFAAFVLFYVGVWMHSKTHAAHWEAYIQKNVTERLKTGTLWGIAVLAFVAVYREVFETVLFYEALLTQSLPSQMPTVVGGFIAGSLCLAVLGWAMIRYSVKLPIGRFFSVTTYLLVGLSFVLLGKGVIALQEASFISVSPLPFSFEIRWIGLKSSWQSLLAQASVIVIFLVFLTRSRFTRVPTA